MSDHDEPYVIFKVKHGGGTTKYTLRDTITNKVMDISISRDPVNPPSQMSRYCEKLNSDYETHTLEIIAHADQLEG